MRQGRRLLTIAGAIVLVIIIGFQYMSYSGRLGARQEAVDKLAAAKLSFARLKAAQKTAESQLAQANDELAGATASHDGAKAGLAGLEQEFPVSVESIEYGEILFGLARVHNVTISNLGSSAPNEQVVDKVSYLSTSFSLLIEGEIPDILGFVHELVNSKDFATAVVEPVSITSPEAAKSGETGEGSDGGAAVAQKPTASLSIVVYKYREG